MDPFKVHVTVTLTSDEILTEADITEIRRLAEGRYGDGLQSGLDDDHYVSDLVNECVATKIDYYRMNEADFDWTGPTWEDLLQAVRGLDTNGEPIPPPEIIGQMGLDGSVVTYA